MAIIENGWFMETGVMNSDQVRLAVKIDQLLEQKQSEYQNVLVFQKYVFGPIKFYNDFFFFDQ